MKWKRYTYKICVKIDSLGFVKQATLIDVVQHSHNDSILLYTLLNMPQWQPAKENGKNIHSSVKFLLHLSPNQLKISMNCYFRGLID